MNKFELFHGGFSFQVSGFHDINQDEEIGEEEEEEEEEEIIEEEENDTDDDHPATPWEDEENFMGGKWPKYPLFLIILGG